jgi:hypothetical protein
MKMNWIMFLAILGHTMSDLVANAVSAMEPTLTGYFYLRGVGQEIWRNSFTNLST